MWICSPIKSYTESYLKSEFNKIVLSEAEICVCGISKVSKLSNPYSVFF